MKVVIFFVPFYFRKTKNYLHKSLFSIVCFIFHSYYIYSSKFLNHKKKKKNKKQYNYLTKNLNRIETYLINIEMKENETNRKERKQKKNCYIRRSY